MIIKSIDRQNIFDIALIGSGAAENAFDIGYKNNMDISDIIIDETNISVDVVTNKKVVAFFAARSTKPATSDIIPTTTFDPTFDETFNAPLEL